MLTSWGFLALRLPEDDKEWLANRVTILQAMGILDEKGNPTERLDAVKAAKMARLDKESFDRERSKMLTACAKCHSRSYAEANLKAGDEVIREVDKIFADSIRTVKSLYDDGILKKPEGWKYAPDLLQFYEAKSSVEQELYLIFLEYRQRAFQGAFHANPDYMHWYGWAKVKEAAARIREDAEQMRKRESSDHPERRGLKPRLFYGGREELVQYAPSSLCARGASNKVTCCSRAGSQTEGLRTRGCADCNQDLPGRQDGGRTPRPAAKGAAHLHDGGFGHCRTRHEDNVRIEVPGAATRPAPWRPARNRPRRWSGWSLPPFGVVQALKKGWFPSPSLLLFCFSFRRASWQVNRAAFLSAALLRLAG